jgi:peptide/nickel transport system substrate-binding protein
LNVLAIAQHAPLRFNDRKPYFDAMEYRIIPDITALTNAVMSGEVNFSNEIPPEDWATVTTNSNLKTQTLEGSRYYWLLPNNTVKPLDNPKARQAIGLALDRKALVAGAFFGQATPILGGVIPEWNWGHSDVKFFGERAEPAKAKALLAEAGVPNGFETSTTIASSFPAMVAMAPIIQANLAAVGIKAQIKTMEIPRYWDEVWGPSKFDVTTMYWVSPLADPDDFVTNNYKCGMAINVQKSCSKEMDAILEEAKSAATQDARKAAYKTMQDLSLQEISRSALRTGGRQEKTVYCEMSEAADPDESRPCRRASLHCGEDSSRTILASAPWRSHRAPPPGSLRPSLQPAAAMRAP